MNFFAFAAFICVFQFVRFSDACEGYDIKIKTLNCNSKNNIKVSPGVSISLSEDCKLLLNNATYSVEQTFDSAKLTFDAKKDIFGMKVSVLSEKDLNLCEFLKEFNVPVDCPALETGTFDVEILEPVDIGDYKSLLFAAVGDVVVKGATISYDDGCRTDKFDLTLTIFKKKK